MTTGFGVFIAIGFWLDGLGVTTADGFDVEVTIEDTVVLNVAVVGDFVEDTNTKKMLICITLKSFNDLDHFLKYLKGEGEIIFKNIPCSHYK